MEDWKKSAWRRKHQRRRQGWQGHWLAVPSALMAPAGRGNKLALLSVTRSRQRPLCGSAPCAAAHLKLFFLKKKWSSANDRGLHNWLVYWGSVWTSLSFLSEIQLNARQWRYLNLAPWLSHNAHYFWSKVKNNCSADWAFYFWKLADWAFKEVSNGPRVELTAFLRFFFPFAACMTNAHDDMQSFYCILESEVVIYKP